MQYELQECVKNLDKEKERYYILIYTKQKTVKRSKHNNVVGGI